METRKLKSGFSRLNLAMFCLLVMLVGCRSASVETGTTTFRVMTYNIHHGEGLDGKFDLVRIAKLIKSERADIVALQEVDKGVERTARIDVAAELASLTGLQCVFSNNYHFQGGEYGNAVLTRFPVKHTSNHLFRMLKAREQRGLLQLALDVQGQEINFWNTHLDAGHEDVERWSSVGELGTLAEAATNQPFLLCGDFNDIPASRVCEKLAGQFDDSWGLVGKGGGETVPVIQPRRRIDYLWIGKNRLITPMAIWRVQSDASDHLPVVAEFQLRPTTTGRSTN